MASLKKDDKRNIRQWTKTPCGSSTIKRKEGSKEFFEAAVKYRYHQYAPWLKKFIRNEKVKGKKILEVGTGMGIDSLEFSKKGAISYGVDITPKHLNLTKSLFGLEKRKINLTRTSAEKLKFPDNYFDYVYSHGVLHHVPDTQKAIKEIYRVLKINGKTVIMVYHKNSFAFWGKVIVYHGILKGKLFKKSVADILSEVIEERSEETHPLVKVYSKKEFVKMMENGGFKIKRTYAKHIMNERRLKRFRKIIPNKILSLLENHFGWYVVVEAGK